jgi:S-adenosylmethionine decarboxylase
VKALGRHLIVEMWDCEAENLNDPRLLEQALRDTVEAVDGTLLDVRVIEFPVHGVTGVAIISESHVAVHTWPEHGYAAVDIFTCNLEADSQAGIEAMAKHFLPGRTQVMEVRRGFLPDA